MKDSASQRTRLMGGHASGSWSMAWKGRMLLKWNPLKWNIALMGLLSMVMPGWAGPLVPVQTQGGAMIAERLAGGLEHPWGMAFLPGGQMLITERAGRLRVLDSRGRLSEPVTGTPEVFAEGQGGLLDVALDPKFPTNGWVYLSFAEPGPNGASTALGRGHWRDGRIEDFQVIFRQEPKVEGPNHFGGRIVFSPDGTLFLTTGERFKFEPAQDLSNHLGTIVRLNPDGSVPEDNPFVGRSGARAEIWSYGHRNVQGAAIHPETGELWATEMGPRDGDELNRIVPGGNYGWPLVSWGRHYNGRNIPDPPTRPDLVDAVKQWTPVISPSGTIFYTGTAFPEWRGSLLISGLSAQGVVRVTLDGNRVTGEEVIPLGARIRDVEQGPDGLVYVLTDSADGELWRLKPSP